MPAIYETGVDIRAYIGGLSYSDIGELCLFEIGGDIKPIDWDYRHQRLARLNAVADMNVLAGNYSSNRRTYFGIAQVELGSLNHRFRLLHDGPVVARVVDDVATESSTRLL